MVLKNLLSKARVVSFSESFEFDMVVLVSNGVPVNSLSDLKGLRLCHPGFDENGWLYDWSEIFSQVWYFIVIGLLWIHLLIIEQIFARSSNYVINGYLVQFLNKNSSDDKIQKKVSNFLISQNYQKLAFYLYNCLM